MMAHINRLDELNKSVENASRATRLQAARLLVAIIKSNGQLKKALKQKKRNEAET